MWYTLRMTHSFKQNPSFCSTSTDRPVGRFHDEIDGGAAGRRATIAILHPALPATDGPVAHKRREPDIRLIPLLSS